MEVYKEEKKGDKRFIYHINREVNEKFGRNKSQDVYGNTKLFWKKVSKVNGRTVESWSRIKDGNERLALGDECSGRIILGIYII